MGSSQGYCHFKGWIWFRFLVFLLFAGSAACTVNKPDAVVEAEKNLPDRIDFNWHVRPILSDKCYSCHGPDANTREAGLRLDLEASAKKELAESPGKYAIVPRRLRSSELWYRITASDGGMRMPPRDSGLALSPEEIAILGRWVEQGAKYQPHWSFIPPEKPALPEVKEESWIRNEIDYFVLERLEQEGLKPAPEADRERLLRRVYLDLTGLPPLVEEIDAFLADRSPDAYETVVDRLLNSPHYGEQTAYFWLDVARFADSHGYSQDGYRQMWPWRDWVIKAFNKNMPFDEFVTLQVAGDLIPRPTQEQRLATAFYRNSRLNSEGGIVPEEYRIEYAADRTNTTGTAFLGITMECARCHDHKFDPISQEEYYQLFAFFNSVNERGLVQKDGNSGSELLLTDDHVDAQLSELDQQISSVLKKMRLRREEVTRKAASDFQGEPGELDYRSALIAHYPVDRLYNRRLANHGTSSTEAELGEGALLAPGKLGRALHFTSHQRAHLGEVGGFDRDDRFSFGFWLNPSNTGESFTILTNAAGKNEAYHGYELYLKEGRLSVRLMHALPADLIQITTIERIPEHRWTHVVLTYDGSSQADGLNLYLDGAPARTAIDFDQLQRTIRPRPTSLRIGGYLQYETEVSDGSALIDDLRIYSRELTELEVLALARASGVDEVPRPSEMSYVEHYLRRKDVPYRRLQEELDGYRTARYQILDSLTGVMVMEDLPEPRSTFVLERGAYDAPNTQVTVGTPEAILEFDERLPADRRGLAQWLVSKDNPLTARVTVNRFWQRYFGRGLVGTADDFGNQGELPTHPELLDWLAREFVDSGWDVKHIHKLIVTSATYRQSSTVDLQQRRGDPENRLLARGPAFRLSAEMIRDNALAAGGLLVRKIGGASVKPYQPKGLWSEKNTFSEILKHYVQSDGEDLYRRSLYTFWRRTSPPPAMTIFDAPTRDSCTVRRQRTNTPLQALVLMNDPQFVEAARVLGERMVTVGGETPRDWVVYAYRSLTGLRPDPQVLEELVELFETEQELYSDHPERARALLEIGEYPVNPALDLADHAASTLVASAIMSLDDTVMRR